MAWYISHSFPASHLPLVLPSITGDESPCSCPHSRHFWTLHSWSPVLLPLLCSRRCVPAHGPRCYSLAADEQLQPAFPSLHMCTTGFFQPYSPLNYLNCYCSEANVPSSALTAPCPLLAPLPVNSVSAPSLQTALHFLTTPYLPSSTTCSPHPSPSREQGWLFTLGDPPGIDIASRHWP